VLEDSPLQHQPTTMPAMKSFATLAAAAAALVQPSLARPAESNHFQPRASGSLSSFVASESATAKQGVLNNIGPNGSKVSGAASGLVIASPSTSNPNCTFPIPD
jgi:hypothetical protein